MTIISKLKAVISLFQSVSLDIQVEECGTAVPVKQVKRPTTLVPYSTVRIVVCLVFNYV